jgi:8-oxo-dGTP diphosphatase
MTLKKIRVVSACIQQNGLYLITQRQPRAVLPLLWEFPGGKVEVGESDVSALKRELLHRLDVEVEVREEISCVVKEYQSYVVDLHLYRCNLLTLKLKRKNVMDYRWVTVEECAEYEFTPADQESMDALLGEHKTI